MTKTYLLTARIGGDHVTDLHFLTADDHPVDEQFHQLPLLLEGGVEESSAHPLAEIFDAADHPGEFHPLAGLGPKLPFLCRKRFVPLFEILAAPLVLGQRD